MAGLRFNRNAVTVAEGQRHILDCVRTMPVEKVPLAEAYGRYLAADVAAAHPLPHFRRSGVDGYALRADDTASARPGLPAELDVLETILCGTVPAHAIGPGQASRIMTGAVVPDGADAVVMLEATEQAQAEQAQAEQAGIYAGGKVRIKKRAVPGENITSVGEEVSRGEALLHAGETIGPGEAALLAAFGYELVPVYRQPKVAIFPTGSELLPLSAPLEPGKIRESNSFMLACQVRRAGGVPLTVPNVPDDPQRLEQALLEAMKEADVLITTGGVSVGDKDVLVELFERWSGRLLFNKVQMRPGSPTSAGLWNGKLLFALSGNPGACFVGFELFVRPYLQAALGSRSPLPDEAAAVLDVGYAKGSAYPRYVRGVVLQDEETVKVRPAGRDKSSVMVSLKDTGCLIHLPAGGQGMPAGSRVRMIRL